MKNLLKLLFLLVVGVCYSQNPSYFPNGYRLNPLSDAPSNPRLSQVYYDSDDNQYYQWNGSSWVSFGTGGSGGGVDRDSLIVQDSESPDDLFNYWKGTKSDYLTKLGTDSSYFDDKLVILTDSIPSSGSSYTFEGGLTESSGTVKLGGSYSGSIEIIGDTDNEDSVYIANFGSSSNATISIGSGISMYSDSGAQSSSLYMSGGVSYLSSTGNIGLITSDSGYIYLDTPSTDESSPTASPGDVFTLIDEETGEGEWMPLSGGGDMLKSVYDTDEDDVVDDAEKVGGIFPSDILRKSVSAHKTDGPLIMDDGIELALGTGLDSALSFDGTTTTFAIGGDDIITIEGDVIVNQIGLSSLNTAPSSASDTGTTGEIRYTSTHIYVCIATDTWVRADLATW